MRYRTPRKEFNKLYSILPKRLENDELRGSGRSGTIAGEWSLAGTLRWLAGGSIYEAMDGPHMARSTAYAHVSATMDAILDCKRLRIRFPTTPEELADAALGFEKRTTGGIMRSCVAAVDGFLIRRLKPTKHEHSAPDRYFSGHKMAVGTNFQVNSKESVGGPRQRLSHRFIMAMR